MAHICRTFSLATLKNVFPEAEYWKQPVPSSTTIPTASNYVHTYTGCERWTWHCHRPFWLYRIYVYTDRVLAPVLEALVPMTADIQKNVARIALKTFCDAWLEFIQNRKIKFRYYIDSCDGLMGVSLSPTLQQYVMLSARVAPCKLLKTLLLCDSGSTPTRIWNKRPDATCYS